MNNIVHLLFITNAQNGPMTYHHQCVFIVHALCSEELIRFYHHHNYIAVAMNSRDGYEIIRLCKISHS